MSEQEKKILEEHLPSVQAIIDAYREQGKELSEEAAEEIREQIRKDMEAGHIDAMENVLGEDLLTKVAGGQLVPTASLFELKDVSATKTYTPYEPRFR